MESTAISSDANTADYPEESSWTFYIQGFVCDNDDGDKNTCYSSEFESPSLVSDAASSAVKKLSANDCDIGFSSGKGNIPRALSKQTSFKKQKTKVMPAMECDLEDTASSPVNSPKVSYMNQVMDQKEKAKMIASELKKDIFGKSGAFAVERDRNLTDLKERICG